MKKGEIWEILEDKEKRVYACGKSFKLFLLYYFQKDLRYPKLAPYHHERLEAIKEEKNIYCQGHRESAKTTILGFATEVWKICYGKTRFIANLCYDIQKAKAFNFILANILTSNQRIIADFGRLYNKRQRNFKDEDFMLKTGIGEFLTTNGVKVKSFGLGQTLRGEIHEHPVHGKVRPDHIYIDDLDNNKNTKNITLIREGVSFLQGEVFGGLDTNAQIIISGNVIRRDGRNIRLKNSYLDNPKRAIFDNFVYGKSGITSGTPLWERFVNTDEEAEIKNKGIENPDEYVVSLESKQNTELSEYPQNWLGIPMTTGQSIIDIEHCQKVSKDNLPDFDFIQIGGDPAFSQKNNADAFGIVITGHKAVGDERFKYVLKSIKLTGKQKSQDIVEATFEQVYHQYKASRIVVENNNGGGIFADGIRKRHLAVDTVSAYQDKLTRLKEFEGEFKRNQIFFVEGETEDLIQQLIEFTGEDGGSDDLVDAMVWSFHGIVDRVIIF